MQISKLMMRSVVASEDGSHTVIKNISENKIVTLFKLGTLNNP